MFKNPYPLDQYILQTCNSEMPKLEDIFNSQHNLTKCGICDTSIDPDITFSFGITSKAEIKATCQTCARKLEYLLQRTQYKPKLYPYKNKTASGREILNQYYVPPHGNNPLWRYMDFSKFMNILETSRLYIPRPCEYEDKLEGEFLLPNEKLDLYKEKYGNEFEELHLRHQKVKQHSRVLSFYYGETQSIGLWNNYCQDRSTGIAMTFKFRQLSSSLSVLSDIGYGLGLVKYIDYNNYHPNKYFPLFNKWDIYEYEKEARIVLYSEEKETIENGHSIGISPQYVSNIYISPYAKKWFIRLVHRIVDKTEFKNVKIIDPILDCL